MNMNPMQIMQMMQQLKSNPMAMLSRYNIPQNIANNPQAVIQTMMNNGTISQAQYNNAMQMAKSMGFNI